MVVDGMIQYDTKLSTLGRGGVADGGFFSDGGREESRSYAKETNFIEIIRNVPIKKR